MEEDANKSGTIDPFVRAVENFIDSRSLIGHRDSVLVAVSGGIDSVAMLSTLSAIACDAKRQWRLVVAHLDHSLRTVSAEDAEFVASLTRKLGLEFILERVDVGAIAARQGQGVEQAGRSARYDFFQQAARQAGATKVAVAHHLDDNVETILYRIIRGTHIRGLCGMPVHRTMEDRTLRLIRPMLGARRAEIRDYVARAGLMWREDESNTDQSFSRNFIRNNLLPSIRQNLNSRVDDAIVRISAVADQVEHYFAPLGKDALASVIRTLRADRMTIDFSWLIKHPPMMRSYVLRSAMEQIGVPMRNISMETFAQIERAFGGDTIQEGEHPAVTLPGGFTMRRDGITLTLLRESCPAAVNHFEKELICPGRTSLPDGRTINCTVHAFSRTEFDSRKRWRNSGIELLDADKLKGKLTCRCRMPGDSFYPLGGPGRQSVSDFMTNQKIPSEHRDSVLCVCDENGMVYLAPFRIDDRVKIVDGTKRVLRIEVLDRPPTPSGN